MLTYLEINPAAYIFFQKIWVSWVWLKNRKEWLPKMSGGTNPGDLGLRWSTELFHHGDTELMWLCSDKTGQSFSFYEGLQSPSSPCFYEQYTELETRKTVLKLSRKGLESQRGVEEVWIIWTKLLSWSKANWYWEVFYWFQLLLPNLSCHLQTQASNDCSTELFFVSLFLLNGKLIML